MRAVLDANVLVSAVIAQGTPQQLLRHWRDGTFESVASERLITELAESLAYVKVRTRVDSDEADRLVALLRRSAMVVDDPAGPPHVTSRDPKDDYLIALAAATRSVLVTGDRDLLALRDAIPVMSPREVLDRLSPDA